MKRYPLDPLLDLAGWNITRVNEVDPCNGPEYRVRKERGVTYVIADRLAAAAGYHPSLIWPDWMNDSIERAARECAADDCYKRFIPSGRRRYCSVQCRQRTWTRKRLATPEGRAKNSARQRRYYRANVELERKRVRRNRARRASQGCAPIASQAPRETVSPSDKGEAA